MDKERDLLEFATVALEQWDLEIESLTLHSQSENTVFRMEAGGEVYALRIHRKGYHDLAALKSEHQWTMALSEAGLFVPEAIPTREGQPYAEVHFPQAGGNTGVTRYVGLIRWLSGTVLSKHLKHNKDINIFEVFENLGEIIGSSHIATSQWSVPSDFKRHAWDEEGFFGEQPIFGRFWEIDAASDNERAELLFIRNYLFELLSSFPKNNAVYGMIHADLNPNNVLTDEDRLSVIDFDDAGFGWFAYDIAVAIFRQMDALTGDQQFDLLFSALSKGYLNKRPASESILEHVPTFLLIKNLLMLRWIQDRPEAGHTDHIPYLLKIALAQARDLGISRPQST